MTRNPVLHFVSYGLQYALIKERQNTLPELLGRLIYSLHSRIPHFSVYIISRKGAGIVICFNALLGNCSRVALLHAIHGIKQRSSQ
ncbi:MAG: hypothetical protein KAT04_04910 [Methylococcales bacterium]|nr:hypothetical protein [Methylococcales bacterium]